MRVEKALVKRSRMARESWWMEVAPLSSSTAKYRNGIVENILRKLVQI